MNYKSSLLSLALVAAAALTSCSPVQKTAEEAPDKDISIQLYSLREVIGDSARYAENHDSVFNRLSEMGYKSVETANYVNRKFYGVTPEQFKADCEAAGLTALSSHATRVLTPEEIAAHDFTEAMKWWDDAIADHKAAGMTYIVTPWSSMPNNLEEAQTLCDYHNAIGEKCREAGLKYGYHTHSMEFDKIPGTETVWMDYLVENTAPENMFWQLDTYLAVKAGASPVEYIKKYPGRIVMLHVKDKYELGQSGMVNFEPIFLAAEASGMKNYVVEQEGTDGTHSVVDAAGMNADYLRHADFVKAKY
ncbi:MAG: sugar phosphate isomerase/epimerase [Muribaculaceae bacterium]|nr:sugar phosphate isomerase/epimerase [Muribaculaceae bacterium]